MFYSFQVRGFVPIIIHSAIFIRNGYRNIKTKGWVVKQKTVKFWNTMAGENIMEREE